MQVISRNSPLWQYLPSEIKGLIEDGEELLDHAIKHGDGSASDFSYLVFSFSKAYEGFLKRMFLDLDLIQEDEYYGDDIRIGRILNPSYLRENRNIFTQLCDPKHTGENIAKRMWEIWRRGRNQVFHYFPHNFRRLSYEEALSIIDEMISTMEAAVSTCSLRERSA